MFQLPGVTRSTGVEREWRVMPPAVRKSEYSPRILSNHATATLGNAKGPCGQGGGCVPLYRTRYLYIHRIVTKGWVGGGVVCTGLMGDGKESGRFLVASGMANGTDEGAGKKYGFAPCLQFPALRRPGGAWDLARTFIEALPAADQKEFHSNVGRR
jgi:hypothetical protein